MKTTIKDEVRSLMNHYRNYMENYVDDEAENQIGHDQYLKSIYCQRAYYDAVDLYCERHKIQSGQRGFIRSVMVNAYEKKWTEDKLFSVLNT